MEITNNINYKALWKSFLVAIKLLATAAALAVAFLGLILLACFNTLIFATLVLALCFVAMWHVNYKYFTKK